MSEERMFRTPYPGYDVLDKWDSPSWNEVTRRAIAKRLSEVPSRRFFDEHEWRTLEAIADRFIPQPDRPNEPVPTVPWIDDKLYRRQGEGYRYFDLPPMAQAWRAGLRGIDQDSERLFGRRFIDLSSGKQDEVLAALQDGEVKGDAWEGMSPTRFFSNALLKEIVSTYYAHPAAWSEIGFGGPASPRGYARLGANSADPWEAKGRMFDRGRE